MIPEDAIGIKLSDDIEKTKTYKITDNKVQGFTDGINALQQAIYKELNTEKYEYPIYSFNYGIEIESLIGKDPIYVKIDFKRRIQECLLKDDRILSVDNFSYSISGDSMLCNFDVKSIYGDITLTKEVNV